MGIKNKSLIYAIMITLITGQFYGHLDETPP